MLIVDCRSLLVGFAGLAIVLAMLAGRGALGQEVGGAGVEDFLSVGSGGRRAPRTWLALHEAFDARFNDRF
jgi:hypothetical protein